MAKRRDPYERLAEIIKSQAWLGRQMDPPCAQQTVHEWFQRRRIPDRYVRQVEKAVNGKVTRYQLRPDVFGDRPDG